MAATRQLSCPSCGAGLRVGSSLTPGKKIKCPKCDTVFLTPVDDEDEAPAAKVTATRPRKATAPPAEDDDEGPAPAKSRKRPKEAAGKTPLILISVAVLVIAVGVTCAIVFWPKKKDTGPVAGGGTPPQMPFGPGGPGGPFGPGGPGSPRRASPIGEIMRKVAQGPGALTPLIGQELKEDNTPWDKIQPQSREFVQLAEALGKEKPSRGSDESWARLTAAYTNSAKELEKAAAAKDRDAAQIAHANLANSCMACHKEHHLTGPRMGMPPGGFGPGGMRPPGAPGFPPGNPGQQPPPRPQ